MPAVAGVLLAAGRGARMNWGEGKALTPICGVPMAECVLRSLRAAGATTPIVAIPSEEAEEIMRQALGERLKFAPQKGSGSGAALAAAMRLLAEHQGPVLVAPCDMPLLTAESFCALLEALASGAVCAVAVGIGGETADASEGPYAFDAEALARALGEMVRSGSGGAFDVSDVVDLMRAQGDEVVDRLVPDSSDLLDVNDLWQLSQAARVLNRRTLQALCISGVAVSAPETTFVDLGVRVGPQTVIEPFTTLTGATRIGTGCRIGPSTHIESCEIGDGCAIFCSHLNRASIADNVRIGPFANIRPHVRIEEGAKIGNFVELKNARIGAGASASHLAYIGDASVGARANIGAGTITCNFDGYAKHRTEIGARAFVGSNSTLVAPVTIGEGAFVAAGSVITKDVPPDALAIARERQETKQEWAANWRKRKEGAE